MSSTQTTALDQDIKSLQLLLSQKSVIDKLPDKGERIAKELARLEKRRQQQKATTTAQVGSTEEGEDDVSTSDTQLNTDGKISSHRSPPQAIQNENMFNVDKKEDQSAEVVSMSEKEANKKRYYPKVPNPNNQLLLPVLDSSVLSYKIDLSQLKTSKTLEGEEALEKRSEDNISQQLLEESSTSQEQKCEAKSTLEEKDETNDDVEKKNEKQLEDEEEETWKVSMYDFVQDIREEEEQSMNVKKGGTQNCSTGENSSTHDDASCKNTATSIPFHSSKKKVDLFTPKNPDFKLNMENELRKAFQNVLSEREIKKLARGSEGSLLSWNETNKLLQQDEEREREAILAELARLAF